ncbi:hypothetical protein [Aurantiacibacter marinus]|nr:hypothetical protein [Aurantiacibacter marinus]
MNSELFVKKGIFGTPKPTDQQIGWTAGFCDAATQSLGLDDAGVFAIMAVSFEAAFGKAGQKTLTRWLRDQSSFESGMIQGGNAYLDWMSGGQNPIMPLTN